MQEVGSGTGRHNARSDTEFKKFKKLNSSILISESELPVSHIIFMF